MEFQNCLISDDDPQFMSEKFPNLATMRSISHLRSSPGHHQANGKSQSFVKQMKTILKKTFDYYNNQYLAWLETCTTT